MLDKVFRASVITDRSREAPVLGIIMKVKIMMMMSYCPKRSLLALVII